MEKEEIKKMNKLVDKFFRSKQKKRKKELQNEIFLRLKEQILGWMKSCLKKKGTVISKEELLSLSWDCFLFCLNHYKVKRDIPLPQHFHTYIKFFLTNNINKDRKENEKFISTLEENDVINMLHKKLLASFLNDQNNIATDILQQLKSFYFYLDNKYKVVFEDALLSFSPVSNRNKVRRIEKSGLPYYKYSESKKIFKIYISYVVEGTSFKV